MCRIGPDVWSYPAQILSILSLPSNLPNNIRGIPQSPRRALLWLAAFAMIGAVMVLIYHDAYQQDSGYHHLFASWAWRHPQYFVGVWARPLFTLLYSFPSQFGYPATKLFTLSICLLTAWRTYRLASDLKFDRPELAIPLLFLQPSFFLISTAALTEPLFALLLITALQAHLSGRIKTGMLIASLMILARPEGFFIGVLWGLWVICDQNVGGTRLSRIPQTLILIGGMILWWVMALLITRDPLWIIHNWPPDWQAAGRANGVGPIWWYLAMLPLITGPLFLVSFITGLIRSLKKNELITLTSTFLTLFTLHSLMFSQGWFGSAGYPRYFVCVSPAIALISLRGYGTGRLRLSGPVISTVSFALSAIFCLIYVDGMLAARDARAIEEMAGWFRAHPRPVVRLINSQAYMRIVLDRDHWEMPGFDNRHDHNLELIRQSPPQTLVFWDRDTGPKWYQLQPADFERAGYRLLKSQTFVIEGYLLRLPWERFGGLRRQQMYLFYKE